MNLSHFPNRALVLLIRNGPLLNKERAIKITKNKSNICSRDLRNLKSGLKIFLNKKQNSKNPKKISIAALEIGIKKI